MANDADQARLERHGRAIRSAYRSARLTPAQRDRHLARLAERYSESPHRPLGTAGALAAAGLLVLLIVAAFAVWNSFSPERDDRGNEAIFTALPTNTIEPGETTAPSVTASTPDPTPSSTIIDPGFGFDAVIGHERLYVVDQNGRVRGRDMETGEELFQFDGGSDVDAALSPDGSRLYLVNHDSLIALDALTGEELWRTPVEDRISWRFGIGPSSVAASQDGERLFVYSSFAPERQWVQIFDASDGSKIGNTETLTGNCPAEMQSSSDGETLYLVCIRFGSMRTIDLNTGENIRSMAGQGSGSVVSPDGQTLYVVMTSKRLITIDMDSRGIVDDAYLDVPATPTLLRTMVAISPDGTRLYVGLGREDNDGDTGSQDVHEIAVIDLANGSTVEVIETNLQFNGKGLAVDRNGWIYANTSSDIVRLVPEAPDPALVTEGQVVVSGDGTEIRQFIVASPVE